MGTEGLNNHKLEFIKASSSTDHVKQGEPLSGETITAEESARRSFNHLGEKYSVKFSNRYTR